VLNSQFVSESLDQIKNTFSNINSKLFTDNSKEFEKVEASTKIPLYTNTKEDHTGRNMLIGSGLLSSSIAAAMLARKRSKEKQELLRSYY